MYKAKSVKWGASYIHSHLSTRVLFAVARHRLTDSIALPKHPALDEPGQDLGKLVLGKRAGGDGKDLVELLEGELLSLGDKKENQNQGDDVGASIEAKGANTAQGLEHGRESEGEDGGPEEVGGNGPGHADFTMGERETLGRVGPRNGAFTWGVYGGEHENKEGDAWQRGRAGRRDPEAEAGGQQSPGHVGEGEQQKETTAEAVNSPDGRPGKSEVDQTVAPRGKQGLLDTGAGVCENGR